MALSHDVMTDEQRKSVALEYLKAFDNGGVTSTGGSILDLFAEDAQVYFPKWGLATGKAEIGKLFGDVGGRSSRSLTTTRISTGSSPAATCLSSRARATASIRTVRGARESRMGAGRWCDVFEIRDWLIQRCFIYLDPDYAGRDTARYPWLKAEEHG